MSLPWQMPSILDVCGRFPCAPEVKALAGRAASPADFVAKLRQGRQDLEAVQSLARFLPKVKAVDWAAQSARMAGEKAGLSDQERAALEAAESWAADPGEGTRAAATEATEELSVNSPAGWAARAATFSEGAEVTPGDVPFDSGDLTAHCAAGAVLLAAAQTAPGGVPKIPNVPAVLDDPLAITATPAPPLEELVEQVPALSEPPALTPPERAEAAKYLEPFIEKGVALARSVPGWGVRG
jgi:hypothetical protein